MDLNKAIFVRTNVLAKSSALVARLERMVRLRAFSLFLFFALKCINAYFSNAIRIFLKFNYIENFLTLLAFRVIHDGWHINS